MYNIVKAGTDKAHIIHELGHTVYHAAYAEILSQEQIHFMLERNYSVEALQKAMLGHEDFFILYGEADLAMGFIAIKEREDNVLRIEKLYLLPSSQGLGLGKQMIDFVAKEAILRHKTVLELNVNRSNKAYYFYLKQGFEVIKEVDIPYFGYVLDDYVMQKRIAGCQTKS